MKHLLIAVLAALFLLLPGLGAQARTFDIQLLLDSARPGSTVTIEPGVYQQCAVIKVDGITIVAHGAHLFGVACQGKGALVNNATDVTIIGLECSRITVPSRNGACVRHQGTNLTLKDVYFHDSETGVLGCKQGFVRVSDSRLQRLGRGGQAHGLYLSRCDRIVVERSEISSPTGDGHLIKSGAREIVIRDSRLICDTDGSRILDAFAGGHVVFERNHVYVGRDCNGHVIGYGLEKRFTHPLNLITFIGNTVEIRNLRLYRIRKDLTPEIVEHDNVVSRP